MWLSSKLILRVSFCVTTEHHYRAPSGRRLNAGVVLDLHFCARQILIVKRGALGDVIRTTPLVRVLEGEITWVTSNAALPFLQYAPRITELMARDDPGFRLEGKYDLVINLEDDLSFGRFAAAVAAENVIGPYLKSRVITYDQSSNKWFDMSLSSRYGHAKADEVKLQNRKTYQEMIFSTVGMTFRGEGPYHSNSWQI